MKDRELREYLKNRRLELGLSLQDVARKSGVNASTIKRWEDGDIENMKRSKIEAYAKALSISPAVIMGWEEPDSEANRQLSYYYDDETAKLAQELFDNKELRALFDVQRGMSADDLNALYGMALALKRKEKGTDDDPCS